MLAPTPARQTVAVVPDRTGLDWAGRGAGTAAAEAGRQVVAAGREG